MPTRERGQPILCSFNPLSFTLFSLQYHNASDHPIGVTVVLLWLIHFVFVGNVLVSKCGGESNRSYGQTGDWQTHYLVRNMYIGVYTPAVATVTCSIHGVLVYVSLFNGFQNIETSSNLETPILL